jgi:hypothetical protein
VQEVARLKNAITVTALPPLPRVNIRLVGAFLGLDDATAATLTVGRKFPNDPPAMFEILDVGHASEDVRRVRPLIGSEAVITVPVAGRRQLPAVVRAGCQPSTENQTCSFGDAVAGIGATVTLPGGFSFVIDDIRPDAAGIPVVARIQFVGRPETVDLIAVGDIDASPRSDAARVIAVRNRTVVSGQIARQTSSTAVLETSTMPERLGSVEVDLRVVADQTAGGIAYRLQALKAGAPFAFDTSKYVVHGTVVSVVPAPQAAR